MTRVEFAELLFEALTSNDQSSLASRARLGSEVQEGALAPDCLNKSVIDLLLSDGSQVEVTIKKFP